MAATNPSALHLLVPDYPLDQIIGVTSGTLSVAAPSGFVNTTANANFAHGFGDSAYFQGIFTADGGTTWNDFGSMIPITVAGNPVFQTVGCSAICDTTNLTITLTSYVTNFVTGTGSAATITYKVFLLAKNTMAQPVNPLPTNQILSFSSGFNFQQIAYKGSLSLAVSSGASGSVSFIHNLGYVPIVRAFQFLSASPTVCRPIGTAFIADPQVELTNTTLTFFADLGSSGSSLNTNIHYRIYL